MEVLSLKLENYRNFSGKKVLFDKRLTVIVGQNGAGKSNILEALSLLSGIRSSRVETDLDLVKFGKEDAKIEAEVESQIRSEEASLRINFQVLDEIYLKKVYFIDSAKKRFVDFVEHFSMVVFNPFDLDLVTGSPSLRRHHLDVLLSSLERDYWRAISSYNKVIVRRNKILQRIRDGESKPPELDFWDSRLLEHGKYISKKRQEFFEYLNFIEPTFSKVSEETAKWLGELSWNLKQSSLSEEKILKNRERDISAGVTLSGPHRDDFEFLFGGKNLEYFGSRGQQRMAVLALKLAELEYFTVKRGQRPVLALDDIFSELDWEHREAVLSIVGKQQTIITAAEKESLPKEIFKKARVVSL